MKNEDEIKEEMFYAFLKGFNDYESVEDFVQSDLYEGDVLKNLVKRGLVKTGD